MKHNDISAQKKQLKVCTATFDPPALLMVDAAKISGKQIPALHLALRMKEIRGGTVIGLNGTLVLQDEAWENWLLDINKKPKKA